MLADQIREFVYRNCVVPARERGERSFSVRAGDVHSDMDLTARLPAISAALGTDKFEREYGLRRTSIEGPINGANCVLTFEILPK